ncbi:hypothetical protein F2P56_030922 [Juglans regia]|uniref:(-)-germacrene D synthase-like n=4 Tax=Juglans TaxID=16718 RepID=A0A833TQP7_JUGRE|nr:probable terpene synthase 2 [Juglans regia]KAF5450587.1 hypothetical protein F2P56_030922 [Juglans regia]QWQ79607.1 TPS49 [Juglans sigillata]
MSLPSSIIPSQTQNPSMSVVKRPLATFHPSVWGDKFISYNSKSMEITSESLEKVQRLKEKVQSLLMGPVDDISQKLELIDAIQRLGVSYQFESEIDNILQQIHNNDDDTGDFDDLYTVSLRFRLLRQQGYNTPSDVFSKFKDSEGINFKESIIHDVRGILSLYEASHMRVHGEDILDEALHFTTTQLESMVSNLNPAVAAQVRRALERPLRKCLPRLEARHYFSTYPETASFNEVVLNFAKLDFNMLQRQHQKEVSELSRWWREYLGVPEKISYVRDRVVELYFIWILGQYFEPQYSHGRMMLGKVTCLLSIMDDTYDAYGTFEELQLFTDAVIRWDIRCIEQLPEYMKSIYKALLHVTKEIEEDMSKEGRIYGLYYTKEKIKCLAQAYLLEAKWMMEKYIPTVEEYIRNALVTGGYAALVTLSFLGMGDATKEVFDWACGNPKIVKAAETIGRLMDDLVSTEFEQKREHVVSAIDCYMKQHGVSKHEAEEEFKKQIVNAWKDINNDFLKPTQVPKHFLERVLNLARVMDVVYKDGDAYTKVTQVLMDGITSLLVDPVQI